ncbi:transposase [Candidatus Parcubacteria bacterium]|nr:transposase [Patescibacteria group bacterium]MBU4309363.1 transposase [Patescibacteria group bacterium]MBU4432570.1 transposase [Patescibacteria group bacterium]MBU4577724.1 transposase [Patescibacteria group bacterium]MCG2697409.1 transposase [Candidatus Parcubacteria bacterium]
MPTLRINIENEDDTHFITITTIEWIDIFTKTEYFDVIIDSLKYCQKNKGLLLFEYVIMTNHIHMICRAMDGVKLSQIVSDFKKHTTREILKLLKTDNRKYIKNLLDNSFRKKEGYENQIWQRENYPEVMTTEIFYNQKLNYIHNNPVKRGFVSMSEDWLYSSARNRVLNDNSLIKLDS